MTKWTSAALAFLFLGCSSTTPATNPDAEPAAPMATARPATAEPATAKPAPTEENIVAEPVHAEPVGEPAAGAEEVHTGTLRYTKLPETMSVEAYLGVDLVLEADGVKLPLASSDAVSKETLIGHDGKSVTVRCVMVPGKLPRPEESYPTDMDGKPMPRPAKCSVTKVDVAG